MMEKVGEYFFYVNLSPLMLSVPCASIPKIFVIFHPIIHLTLNDSPASLVSDSPNQMVPAISSISA